MVKKAAVLAGVGLGLGAVYLWAANNALKEGTSGLAPPAYRVPPRHRVSLCVPAYNEEKYIGNLLTSARNQTESFHSMVVADCSEFGDSTSLMAMRLGAKVLRVANGNISASRNLAAAWDGRVFRVDHDRLQDHPAPLRSGAGEGGGRFVQPA